MATTFKTFSNNDIVSTRTLLHEAIPITGSIISGTYGKWPNEDNIKNYSHGMFQSVYDYPYLSSSSNHLFDITCGYSGQSVLSSSTNVQNSKKINLYNQMAQVLMGHSTSGTIKEFEIPGSKSPPTGDGDGTFTHNKMRECYFFNFSRLLVKDEIKKGSFSMTFMTGAAVEAPQNTHDGGTTAKRVFSDAGAQNNYFTNSPAGEYAILTASSAAPETAGGVNYTQDRVGGARTNYAGVGLVFYQAGVAVISSSLFWEHPEQRHHDYLTLAAANKIMIASYPPKSTFTFRDMFTGSVISGTTDGLRNRIADISFNNTTELNSTIYFCRAHHNEFNYSSNPTYLDGSKIRVKDSSLDQPVSYITTVGLYSADNELLAIAKLSEPLKKAPDNELTIRVRLDY
jgi:hypothetical protein